MMVVLGAGAEGADPDPNPPNIEPHIEEGDGAGAGAAFDPKPPNKDPHADVADEAGAELTVGSLGTHPNTSESKPEPKEPKIDGPVGVAGGAGSDPTPDCATSGLVLLPASKGLFAASICTAYSPLNRMERIMSWTSEFNTRMQNHQWTYGRAISTT